MAENLPSDYTLGQCYGFRRWGCTRIATRRIECKVRIGLVSVRLLCDEHADFWLASDPRWYEVPFKGFA